ncbi:hypothetical protein LXL04_016924 [Taraxacum kok-saghyz]
MTVGIESSWYNVPMKHGAFNNNILFAYIKEMHDEVPIVGRKSEEDDGRGSEIESQRVSSEEDDEEDGGVSRSWRRRRRLGFHGVGTTGITCYISSFKKQGINLCLAELVCMVSSFVRGPGSSSGNLDIQFNLEKRENLDENMGKKRTLNCGERRVIKLLEIKFKFPQMPPQHGDARKMTRLPFNSHTLSVSETADDKRESLKAIISDLCNLLERLTCEDHEAMIEAQGHQRTVPRLCPPSNICHLD